MEELARFERRLRGGAGRLERGNAWASSGGLEGARIEELKAEEVEG